MTWVTSTLTTQRKRLLTMLELVSALLLVLYKGIGTQFDPEFARLMISFIDLDTSYTMQEGDHLTNEAVTTRLQCGELYEECTEGTEINDRIARIRLYSKPEEGFPERESMPSLVLFDALDGRIHTDEFKKKDLLYFEYARIRLNGETWMSDIHAENIIEAEQTKDFRGWNNWKEKNREGLDYTVTLVREGNTVVMETENLGLSLHARTVIHDDVDEICAAITGDQCAVTDIRIRQ